MLENVQDFPLGNKPQGGKSPLAGVQDKIVLAHTAEGWNRALDGYPSSHLLKPVPNGLPTVIYDEEYGARLARAVGLSQYRTWIQEVAGVPALGNLDMHAKNISPLHLEDGTMELAAAYDFVPQAPQRNDGEMALAIPDEYRHTKITRAHLIEEALSWDLHDTESIIDEVLRTVPGIVRCEAPHPLAYQRLAADISPFTQNLLEGRAAGLPTGEQR